MKTFVLSAMALACAAGVASADVYGDAPFDIFDLGFTHLDITSVTVTNDASFLNVTIQVAGDAAATDWGKYALGIDTGAASHNSNAWGRNVDWGRGISHFSAMWVDGGGGAEIYNSDGLGGWNLIDATYGAGTEINHSVANAAFGVLQINLSLAGLGIGVGDTIEFDVFTTGGGADPGVDHLSRADMATPGWGDTSVSGQFDSYTVVPSPASAALLGLGGLVGLRRRR